MTTSRNKSSLGLLGFLLGGIALVFVLAFMWPDDLHLSDEHTFRTETFVEGLDVPWGMVFLPDGRLLVTERPGTLRLVEPDGTMSDPIAGTPDVCACGQGGLLDVQLHPQYEDNGWLYLSYSDILDGGADYRGFTAIMRARLDGQRLVDQEVLFKAPDEAYSTRGQHFGSRIVFDEAGYLYFTVGDRGSRDDAQRLDTPNGKVHRIHDDGRIPEDNPFVDEPGAVASIWSYGHRNPQGMDRHPETGVLWATEHGPRGGDELNPIGKGLNYGWPVITYGINYNGTPITDITEKDGMEQPALHWTPSIAVCGIGFYTGEAFPEWTNNLFVTSLKFSELRRLVLDGTTITHQEVLIKPDGRLRDVATGPDGYLYVAVGDTPGRIIRLVPTEG